MVVTTATVVASGGCTPFTGTYFAASATNTVASYLRTPLGLYQISAVTDSTHMTMIVPTAYTSETLTNNASVRVYNKLFGSTSADFSSTAVSLLSLADTVQPAYTVSTTDKLASIDFMTASTNNRVINIAYNGNTHNSFFSAPFIISHESLPGLLGGAANDHYHSNLAEYTGTGTGIFVRQSAPTITGHPTVEGVTATGATGTGKFVFDTSPVLVTPNIGVANGTSLVLGGTIDANAILDIQSTTKAFMPPRMTTAQRDAIGTPTAGMVIYNSTSGRLEVFNTLWQTVNSSMVSAKTTTYAILSSDDVITCDATSAAFTVTLPDAIPLKGKIFDIKKIDSTINAATIATTSSQTIDGITSRLLNSQYQSLTVISDGSNWSVK
jgi:hypothetical protein